MWAIEALRGALDAHKFDLWAYVLMPEHLHVLVNPVERVYSTSAFLKSLKQSVTSRALRFVRQNAPAFLPRMADRQADGTFIYRFWQRSRGYDRNIWEPRYVWEMIEYIHRNPIRRGLCERPEDWVWSSAGDYGGVRTGPVRIDFHTLPSDPRR